MPTIFLSVFNHFSGLVLGKKRENPKIAWWYSLVFSLPSKNEFFALALKNGANVNIKVFWFCPRFSWFLQFSKNILNRIVFFFQNTFKYVDKKNITNFVVRTNFLRTTKLVKNKNKLRTFWGWEVQKQILLVLVQKFLFYHSALENESTAQLLQNIGRNKRWFYHDFAFFWKNSFSKNLNFSKKCLSL